jgi:hypothetical protein
LEPNNNLQGILSYADFLVNINDFDQAEEFHLKALDYFPKSGKV